MARMLLLGALAATLMSAPASANAPPTADNAGCTILSAAELATVVPSLGAGTPDHPDDPSGLCKNKDTLTFLANATFEEPRPDSNRKIETPAPGLGAQSRIETFNNRYAVTFVQGNVIAGLDVKGGTQSPDKTKVLALAKVLAGRL